MLLPEYKAACLSEDLKLHIHCCGRLIYQNFDLFFYLETRQTFRLVAEIRLTFSGLRWSERRGEYEI
jgi:hypothetical protein